MGLSTKKQGILFALAASFLFGLMSFLVHHASRAVPYSQIVFVRAVVSSFVLLPVISPADLTLRRPATTFLILRGLAGSVALCSYFWTLANTSVGNARILADLAPLLVAVLGWLLLQERLSPRQMAAIASGVVGSVVLSWPGADSTLKPLVVAVGLLGALATAIAFLSLRQATREFSPETIVFVFNLILCGFVVFIPSVAWIIPNFWQSASVLGVAATGLGGQLCLTRAFARLPATVATGINPSVLLFGVLLDWLLEGDSPTQSEWLSYLLIILGVWGIIPRSPAPKLD